MIVLDSLDSPVGQMDPHNSMIFIDIPLRPHANDRAGRGAYEDDALGRKLLRKACVLAQKAIPRVDGL